MEEALSPFLLGKVVSGDLFVDREQECERLRMNCVSGINTILISPRRWGKSSLVRRVALDMRRQKNVRFAWIDLFHIRSEDDLLERMTEAVVKASTTKLEERVKDVKEFLKGVVPQIGFGGGPTERVQLDTDLA